MKRYDIEEIKTTFGEIFNTDDESLKNIRKVLLRSFQDLDSPEELSFIVDGLKLSGRGNDIWAAIEKYLRVYTEYTAKLKEEIVEFATTAYKKDFNQLQLKKVTDENVISEPFSGCWYWIIAKCKDYHTDHVITDNPETLFIVSSPNHRVISQGEQLPTVQMPGSIFKFHPRIKHALKRGDTDEIWIALNRSTETPTSLDQDLVDLYKRVKKYG